MLDPRRFRRWLTGSGGPAPRRGHDARWWPVAAPTPCSRRNGAPLRRQRPGDPDDLAVDPAVLLRPRRGAELLPSPDPTDNGSCEYWMARPKCERLYDADTASMTPTEVLALIDRFIHSSQRRRGAPEPGVRDPGGAARRSAHSDPRGPQERDGAGQGRPGRGERPGVSPRNRRQRASGSRSEAGFSPVRPKGGHRAVFVIEMEGADGDPRTCEFDAKRRSKALTQSNPHVQFTRPSLAFAFRDHGPPLRRGGRDGNMAIWRR